MKKIALILSLFIAALTTYAQSIDNTYQFTKEDGTIIENGSTMNITSSEVEVYSDGGIYCNVHSGIFIKNTSSSSDKKIRVHWNIEKIECGSLSFCFPVNCFIGSTVGEHVCEATTLKAGEIKDMNTHWETEAYGSCDVRYIIELVGSDGKTHVANGPSILAHYYLNNPASVEGITTKNTTEVAYYSIDGKQLSKPVKGLNLVKMSDGKIIKKIYK